ncbi:MAG: NAD(P)H-hydrate dehydratase [Paludibacteraceae bacterium]|nr:NAD(P)H-hydrate dehydratase [Paludibacteraceae bacterium]
MNLQDAVKLYKPRNPEGHKGSFGKALLIAGSTGMMGAAVLCTKACLRSGVGLCHLSGPMEGMLVAQISLPEAIYRVGLDKLSAFDAVGCGCGIGKSPDAIGRVDFLLNNSLRSVVLDADALNIIVERWWLSRIPFGAILTPHSVEFERLYGSKASSREEQIKQAVEFADKRHCIVVLKGAGTAVINEKGDVDINTTGNSGMATAGSGDVLTGIITGLIAQGYERYDAARLGVFLHGLAGDIAAEEKCQESILASDIIEAIPKAFKKIIYGK